MTLRYFRGHGPATAKDFKSWSSLAASEIKKGLEFVAPQLKHELIDGVSFWSPESAAHGEVTSPTVHLLQGHDEYIMGYSETKYVLHDPSVDRSMLKDKVIFNHIIILDGRVAGHLETHD